jgi:hypothetical protein
VLQQELRVKDQEGELCIKHDKHGGGLKITKQGKFPGYKFWVWFSKKAITNIICLKNLIKINRVTYDSKVEMTFVVHPQQFGFSDLFFEMHQCGLLSATQRRWVSLDSSDG